MRHEPRDNTAWLIIAPGDCDASVRELGSRFGWPLVERVDDALAARVVAATDAERVVVAGDGASSAAPVSLTLFLARLDSVRVLACVAPEASPDAERLLGASGALLFPGADAFGAWAGALNPALSSSRPGSGDRDNAPAPGGRRRVG